MALLIAALPLSAQTADQLLDARIPDLVRGKATPEEIVALYLADLATETPVSVPAVQTTADYLAAASAAPSNLHLGAPAGAPASTSLVQRPGFAELLSLAVENGAISESQTGSALTITTTPYALAGFLGNRDHPGNWSRFRWLRQLSVSATILDPAPATGGDDLRNLTAGSVTLKLTGSATPRDMAPQSGDCASVLPAVVGASYSSLLAQFTTWTQQNAGAGVAAVRSQLASLFGTSVPSAQAPELAACAAGLAADAAGQPSEIRRLRSMLAAYFAQRQSSSLSITASAQRDPAFSDFATLALVYAFDPPSKLVFNVNGAVHHNFGERAAGVRASVDRLRAYALTFSSTATGNRFDGTLTAQHVRNNQIGAKTTTLVQLSGNLKISPSATLPIGITWAPEPVGMFSSGWHVHVGIGSVLDHILSQPATASP